LKPKDIELMEKKELGECLDGLTLNFGSEKKAA